MVHIVQITSQHDTPLLPPPTFHILINVLIVFLARFITSLELTPLDAQTQKHANGSDAAEYTKRQGFRLGSGQASGC